MRLSELKELRPDVWEIAKRECLRLYSFEDWLDCVKGDDGISNTLIFTDTKQGHDPWDKINYYADFTLMDKWIAENEHTV